LPNKAKILLVEDDSSLVELLSFHLRRSEFEVETTPDGEDALLMARETPSSSLVVIPRLPLPPRFCRRYSLTSVRLM